MHPANVTENALTHNPADVHEFIELVKPHVTVTPIRNHPDAAALVKRVDEEIAGSFGTGATLDTNSVVVRWRMTWYSGWQMLHGHAYPDRNKPGKIDVTSPLLLVDRRDGSAVYGAELEPLARRVLAHSLAYDALSNRT
jgi:hypothetical protein